MAHTMLLSSPRQCIELVCDGEEKTHGEMLPHATTARRTVCEPRTISTNPAVTYEGA